MNHAWHELARVYCRTYLGLLPLLLILLSPAQVAAGEWPQILGPDRNGQAEGEELAASWPAAGPKTVWERKVGTGFAGLAVAQRKAILFHRINDEECVEALDPRNGAEIWKNTFPATYRGSYVEDNGPRCVPTIHDDRIVVYGAQGDLRCLALKTGKEIWARHAFREFGADPGYFGAGSTPLVEGDKVLVNVGGARKDAGLVAFSLKDGATVWKVTHELASYSAPIAVTLDGVRHVIFVTRLNVVSIDPDNGHVRFQFPFGKTGPTVNAATPLVVNGNLFVTANYGVGAAFAKIGKSDAKLLWQSDNVLSSQYVTCVLHDGFLFGVDGQDSPEVELRCFDPKTQQIAWVKNGFGMASLLDAGGKLLALKTSGELVLLEASPERFRQLASARVLTSTTRALPALSNGLLYVRDTSTLKCLEVGKAKD